MKQHKKLLINLVFAAVILAAAAVLLFAVGWVLDRKETLA